LVIGIKQKRKKRKRETKKTHISNLNREKENQSQLKEREKKMEIEGTHPQKNKAFLEKGFFSEKVALARHWKERHENEKG
jgi:hypothetical protein